jgi:hypothetical protein
MEPMFSPAPGLVVLPDTHPVPGWGCLPVSAFLLRGAEPVLVDCGMRVARGRFLESLDGALHLSSLRHIVITHEDADHAGALEELLVAAPDATLVASPIGLGKLAAAMQLPRHRIVVAEPGATLTLGERRLRVFRPPLYDSPATIGLFAEHEGWCFTSDAFAAFLPAFAENLADVPSSALARGFLAMSATNSPWVAGLGRADMAGACAEVQAFAPSLLLAAHLPVVRGDEELRGVLELAAMLPEAARAAEPARHEGRR